MAEVSRIPVPDPLEDEEGQAVVNAPAIGYSITANLGDDRQMVVQCFVAEDDPLPVISHRVDKVMAVIDRQKAKYRKVEIEKSVEEMEKTLRRLKADLSEAEEGYNRRAQEIVAARDGIQSEAIGKGRSAPVGADAQRFKTLGLELEKLTEERKVARGHAYTNISRYDEEIGKAKEQIAECDALIAGG